MKTVLIVGGTRGLGWAMSEAFARAGWQVVATWHQDEESAERAAKKLGGGGMVVKADGRDALDVRRVAELEVVQKTSQLIYIHNAATPFVPKPLHLHFWDDYEKQMAVGLRSLHQFTSLLLPLMAKAKYGRIVPILTRAIHPPVPKGMVAYLTNKAAMLEFSRCLEVEYQKQGIHSFCVEPSFMESAYTKSWPEGIRVEAEKSLSTEPSVLASKIVERCLETSAGSGGCELQG